MPDARRSHLSLGNLRRTRASRARLTFQDRPTRLRNDALPGRFRRRKDVARSLVYIPPSFEIADPARALEIIESYPFGLLITCEEGIPYVSHLPFIAKRREEGLSVIGHVARGNPHARAVSAERPATVVFNGPHAYVSASWYERPYETVPTWNYAAVHLCGRLQETDAWEAVRALSDAMEG